MTLDRRSFLATCAAGTAYSARGWPAGAAAAGQAPWRSTFPALNQQVNGHPVTYLDSAATTLRPQSVIDALTEFYATDNANPSPVHTLARRAGARLATARQAVARFIHAPSPAEIIFVRGTTEGLNLVANTWAAANLRSGDEIVLTLAEHASNLMPWTRAARQAGAAIRVVGVDDEGRPRLEELKRLLSSRTRLMAFSHVSNVLGFVNPAKEMCALAKQAGACVVIDGAQSAPHVSIDVQDLGCDFYVFSGHKMLGPMASGVVWGRQALLDAMPPFHVGSNMAHDVEFDGAAIEHGAQKFQAGTPDVAGPVGLTAAIAFLEHAGAEALWRHDQALVRHGLARLTGIRGLRLIGPKAPEHRIPVFTFELAGKSPAAIAKALDAQGIAIR
ncbi:MAG TPA: cysteine desulfurase, partial [Vicinamibacterales bacterium]|nr:cysteine desulfurase [Vicinamibacterales bacterium]